MISRRPVNRQTRGRIATGAGSAASGGPGRIWEQVSSQTCLAAWQIHFGLTMGGTPLASGTTPPAITLTGTTASNVALRLEIQTTGTDGVATYRYGAANDGTTSTFIESGKVVPAGGGTYAAIGALTGITFNFPAGTYTNDNVYQGTASAWTDQKSSLVAAQGTAAKQPRILLNASGYYVLRSDGTNDSMLEPTLDRPAPGTQSTFIYFITRQITWAINTSLLDNGPGTRGLTMARLAASVTPEIAMYNGGAGGINNNGATIGSLARVYAHFTGSTSDAIKAGAATESTGINTGNNDPSPGVRMFATNADTQPSNIELVAAFYFNGRPTGTEITNMDNLAATLFPGILI